MDAGLRGVLIRHADNQSRHVSYCTDQVPRSCIPPPGGGGLEELSCILASRSEHPEIGSSLSRPDFDIQDDFVTVWLREQLAE